MTLLGADPDGLEMLAGVIGRTVERIERAERDIGRQLEAAAWRGADADRTRSEWRRQGSAAVHRVRATLVDCAADLRAQAAAQRLASGADAIAGIGAGAGGGGGGSWGGHGSQGGEAFAGRAWRPDGYWEKEGRVWGEPAPRQPDGDSGPRGRRFDDSVGARADWELLRKSSGWGDPDWTPAAGPVGLFAGARAVAHAGMDVDQHGLRAGTSGRGSVGVEAQSGYSGRYGSAQGRAAVEAAAEGELAVTGGPTGAAATAGADLLVGGRIEGAVSGPEIAGVTAGAEGSLSYGAGLKGDLEAKFSTERVRVKFVVGATWGIGGSLGGVVEVNPQEMFETVQHELDELFD